MTAARAPRTALAVATGAALVATSPARAVTVPLADPAGPRAELRGGADRFTGNVALPRSWRTVGGRVVLRWRGSPQLAERSGLQVRIGDTVVGSARVGPGAGAATFAVPRQTLARGVHDAAVSVESRLRTRVDPCPAPDDPTAWVQFDRSAALELSGAPSAGDPPLRSLPDALVAPAGRGPARLLVRFATPPTGDALRAAAFAAGEVSAAAGGDGARVRVAVAGTSTRRRPGETVIAVTERPGAPEVRTDTVGADRATLVAIAGTGDGLLRAAGALRPSVARGLPGTVAGGDALPAVRVVRPPVPRRLRLPTGEATGLGAGRVTLGFHLPVWREALRGARLRLAATYDAPAGGRATVSINDRVLAGTPLVARGRSRFALEQELAPRGPALNLADLRAGDNTVAVDTDLARPPYLRCAPQDDEGAVRVQDAGSVTVQTRERPVTTTLSLLPFPLDRRPGWAGTTVAVPERPTEPELAAVVGTLAEARRVAREPALPRIVLGGPAPDGTALILARPGAVPAELTAHVPGPLRAGVLTVSRDGDDVRVLAIGPEALAPLAQGYAVGKVRGRTVEALSRTDVAIRVPDAQLVTGIERNPVPWRWPLVVLGGGILLIAAIALQRTAAALRRRTQGSASGPSGGDDGHAGA